LVNFYLCLKNEMIHWKHTPTKTEKKIKTENKQKKDTLNSQFGHTGICSQI